MKRTPLKKRNPKRRARLFIEDFGGKEYLEVIHSMPCAVCDAPCEWTEAAHLTSRGAGVRPTSSCRSAVAGSVSSGAIRNTTFAIRNCATMSRDCGGLRSGCGLPG